LNTILKEVGNELILITQQHGDSTSCFKGEPPEVLLRLEQCDSALRQWKKAVLQHVQVSEEKIPACPWRIDKDSVFSRIDIILLRVQQMREIILTFVCYFRLERIEIGGPKGGVLSKRMAHIFSEFMQQYDHFGGQTYDALDPEEQQFSKDAQVYKDKSRNWERRLTAIVSESLESEPSVVSAFKTIDSFEGLLNSEEARHELQKKLSRLFERLATEIQTVQKAFTEGKENPPKFYNFPFLAGCVWWVHSLASRIEPSMKSFLQHA
ncbi:MAG: putative flagellar outer dynein arm heavy chain beta, partial [Streblomastix strix]